MFVKVVNGSIAKYPYSMTDLRRDNPLTSFPSTVRDETINRLGVFRVLPSAPAIKDRVAYRAVEAKPENVGGEWVQRWSIVPYNDADARVRQHRDRLLAETDYMMLPDNAMSEDWAVYRQALRDITLQEGFPLNVVWPRKPENVAE